MIRINNLFMSFNDKTVLNDISVKFEPGKTILL